MANEGSMEVMGIRRTVSQKKVWADAGSGAHAWVSCGSMYKRLEPYMQIVLHVDVRQ